MLRKLLDFQLSLTEKGKPLHAIHPLISAMDTFLYEAPLTTTKGPHIRDAVDLKRWMIMVVYALFPCILMAIWNTGVQSLVYTSGDYRLMDEYLTTTVNFSGYWDFVTKDTRWLEILKLGAMAFIPVMLISYAVGGLCEGIIACIRGHEIAEGFLVTGMLYPLILPSTIPYWMVAVGVAVGVILSKELFGGTGQNIMNPALVCRCFLFFTWPGKMSGFVWAGTNPTVVRDSLTKMNQDAGLNALDGYTQATKLAIFNVSHDIKRVHVDAIATNNVGRDVGTIDVIEGQLAKWNAATHTDAALGHMTSDQMQSFVTTPLADGGLGLSSGSYYDAYQFSALKYGIGHNGDGSFFFGDRLDSMGSSSVLACLIGAIILISVGIGSWRTMLGVILGALGTATLFEYGSRFFGIAGGAYNPAQFDFPAYKHLLLGGLAFGLVYMATDPVSSPTMDSAKWFYGILIGVITMVIRDINPAYPEGVMLAILLGNVAAPLIDHYAAQYQRSRRPRRVTA
ncbi:MAG: NADH:ubiquinone reductase (Na(+)-transporting) subunit B [Nitrosomonas sp.]|nr:MAG: NADH:ubiquinone reductase (Na(+)-transporting) subunit B [Nitrosomonas sp.]